MATSAGTLKPGKHFIPFSGHQALNNTPTIEIDQAILEYFGVNPESGKGQLIRGMRFQVNDSYIICRVLMDNKSIARYRVIEIEVF